MSDPDIVTQLRVLTDTLLLGDFQGLAATTASAADEIERLRKELEESESLLDEYQREAADRTRWENTDD